MNVSVRLDDELVLLKELQAPCIILSVAGMAELKVPNRASVSWLLRYLADTGVITGDEWASTELNMIDLNPLDDRQAFDDKVLAYALDPDFVPEYDLTVNQYCGLNMGDISRRDEEGVAFLVFSYISVLSTCCHVAQEDPTKVKHMIWVLQKMIRDNLMSDEEGGSKVDVIAPLKIPRQKHLPVDD